MSLGKRLGFEVEAPFVFVSPSSSSSLCHGSEFPSPKPPTPSSPPLFLHGWIKPKREKGNDLERFLGFLLLILHVLISHSSDSVSWFTQGFEMREREYYLMETEKEDISRRLEALTAEKR